MRFPVIFRVGTRITRVLVCVWAGTVATGCTTVSIYAGGELVGVERHFGILRIEPVMADSNLVIRSRGVGFIPLVSGFALGLAKEDFVSSNAHGRCNLVLFSGDQIFSSASFHDWLTHPLSTNRRRNKP